MRKIFKETRTLFILLLVKISIIHLASKVFILLLSIVLTRKINNNKVLLIKYESWFIKLWHYVSINILTLVFLVDDFHFLIRRWR